VTRLDRRLFPWAPDSRERGLRCLEAFDRHQTPFSNSEFPLPLPGIKDIVDEGGFACSREARDANHHARGILTSIPFQIMFSRIPDHDPCLWFPERAPRLKEQSFFQETSGQESSRCRRDRPFPGKTTDPPSLPAPGPRSMISSAARIIRDRVRRRRSCSLPFNGKGFQKPRGVSGMGADTRLIEDIERFGKCRA